MQLCFANVIAAQQNGRMIGACRCVPVLCVLSGSPFWRPASRELEAVAATLVRPSLRALTARLPAIGRVLLFDERGAARYGPSEALAALRRWAMAIGPSAPLVESDPGLVDRAHALGMLVLAVTGSRASWIRS